MLIFFQLLLLLIFLFLFLQNHNSSDNGKIGALTITINHNPRWERRKSAFYMSCLLLKEYY